MCSSVPILISISDTDIQIGYIKKPIYTFLIYSDLTKYAILNSMALGKLEQGYTILFKTIRVKPCFIRNFAQH